MHNLTITELEKNISSLSLIEFFSNDCYACFLAEPFLVELEKAYENKCKISKLNVIEYKQVISVYNINKLPTFILFNNFRELNRIVGFRKSDIEKMIRFYLKG